MTATAATPAPPERLHIEPKPTTLEPGWTAAPSGPGEFLIFLHQYIAGTDREVAGRKLIATQLGLLESQDGENWAIVPGLYGRHIWIIQEQNGMLWVRERGKDILGLDPKDLSIRKRIAGVSGQCFLVTKDRFWCVDHRSNPLGRMSTSSPFQHRRATPPSAGWTVLIEYDHDGNLLREFKTDGTSLPVGQIYWFKPDGDSIWLAVIDFQGISPIDTHLYGDRRLVQFDRQSGKVLGSAEINARVGTGFADLPDRILWAMPSGKKDTSALHQLSKEDMSVSVAAELAVPYVRNIWSDGTYLWIFGDESVAVSLKDYAPIALEEYKGKEPRWVSSPYGHRDESLTWYRLLGADADRVWLRANGPALIELRDDATSHAWDLSGLAESPLYMHDGVAAGDRLYVAANDRLLRFTSGSATVLALEPGTPGQGYVPFLAGNRNRLWVQRVYRGPLLALSPELEHLGTIPAEDVEDIHQRYAVPVGDSLLFWHRRHSGVWLASGDDGVKKLDSWETVRPSVEEKTGARPPRSFGTLPFAGDSAAFLFHRYELGPQGRARVDDSVLTVVYDPGTDRWTTTTMINHRGPFLALNGARGLYFAGDGTVGRWSKDGWRDIGHLSFETWQPRYWNEKVVGTDRYLYTCTPIGLYRVRWNDLPLN